MSRYFFGEGELLFGEGELLDTRFTVSDTESSFHLETYVLYTLETSCF